MSRSSQFASPAAASTAWARARALGTGAKCAHRASRVLLIAAVSALVPAMLLVSGCASAGIALREQFGVAKRQQLVDRVEDARDSQEEAKEQFQSALDQFLSVTGQTGTGGELEARYRALSSAYDRSASRAETVGKRIDSVEAVGSSLFREWNAELSQYTDDRLRAASEAQLRESKSRYDELIRVMRSAESRMKPVLASLNNQVLYLKHNLNAQAIAGLQGTAIEVENDLTGLIREMEEAIAEADRFISQMTAAE